MAIVAGAGTIGIVLLILGVIMLLFSMAPSPLKTDLRIVGELFAILGAIIVVVLAVL